jgi:SAM-dependent methyltransferase
MQQSSQVIPSTGPLWHAMARQWALLASPVRPCAEDIHLVAEMLGADTDLFAAAAKRRVWLLGVTPEIARADCLQGVELVAVDRVRAMIDSVWPGDNGRRKAVCADWLRAPFADESFDLAIGDGCLTHVAFPDGVASLLASVHRCLRPGGFLLLRQFCPPDVAEPPAAVIAALRSGGFASIHVFKWRLAMAVQGAADAPDVMLDEVWRAWSEARIDVDALVAARGWPPEEIRTMDAYRGSSTRYNFMRLDTALGHLDLAGFDLVARRTGTDELAERCPHLLARKRRSSAGTDAS